MAFAGMDRNTESRKKKPRQHSGVIKAPKIGRRLVILVMPQQAPSIIEAESVWSKFSVRETALNSRNQVMLLAYHGKPSANALLASIASIGEISGRKNLIPSERPAKNSQQSVVIVRYPRNLDLKRRLRGKKEIKQAMEMASGIEAIAPRSKNCGLTVSLMTLFNRTKAVRIISLPIKERKNSKMMRISFFIYKTVP